MGDQQGLTILEIMVSITIVVILFGLGATALFRIQKNITLSSSDSTVANVLSTAARHARDNVSQSPWGVYLDYDETTREGEAFILFAGSSYTLRDPTKDITYPMLGSFLLTSVELCGSSLSSGDDHEIVFSPISGATTQYGSITIESYGVRRFINISPEGIITISY